MGLPLFVAPVESDLQSKAASKGTTASPARSGIRRLSRQDSRENRNAIRNASVRIYGAVQPRLTRSTQDGLLPWVESPGPLEPSLPEPRSRPVFQDARDLWPGSSNPATILRNRQNFQQQVESIFDWRERGPLAGASQRETETRDAEDRWWSSEARSSSRTRRAQVVPPLPSRFDRSPDRPRPYRSSPGHGHQGSRAGPLSPLSSVHANPSRASGPRYNARPLRSVRDRRTPNVRHAVGLDGLGDRDRSLSPEGPEVWDTLLSTLTPDPQQPSAGSSFASMGASQGAGPPPDAPLDAMGQVAEAQCDSGCEHSDANMDEEDEENVDIGNARRRRHISTYTPDGPVDGPAGRLAARARSESRREAPQTPADGAMPLSDSDRRGAQGENAGGIGRGMPLARLLNHAEAWGGPASGEDVSEEESGGGGARRRQSTGRGHNATLSGEEGWSGMQRIVSSLARREDIPDEWWAEVGLSRTLPQDDATNQ